MAIRKTTEKTKIAIHQTSNKTETRQTNNHVDFAKEQIISPGIFKPVLLDWDMSRECRIPRQSQNNKQQTSNGKQNSRIYNQDRNASSSQQQITLD